MPNEVNEMLGNEVAARFEEIYNVAVRNSHGFRDAIVKRNCGRKRNSNAAKTRMNCPSEKNSAKMSAQIRVQTHILNKLNTHNVFASYRASKASNNNKWLVVLDLRVFLQLFE